MRKVKRNFTGSKSNRR